MKKSICVLLGMAGVLLSANGVLGVMLVYQGNGDPLVNDSVRHLDTFTSYAAGPGNAAGRRFVQMGTATSNGSLVSDADAKDGFAWQIDNHLDAIGKSSIFKAYMNDGTSAAWPVNATGATLVARMKVESAGSPGGMLRIDDSSATTKSQGSAAWTGAGANSGSVREFANGSTSAFTPVSGVTDLGGYHIVRLTALGNISNIYIDENPTPALTSTTTVAPFGAVDAFAFGAFGGSAKVKISFDYIAVVNGGAYAPEASPAAGSFNAQVNLLALPEPSTLALLVMVGLFAAGRRMRGR